MNTLLVIDVEATCWDRGEQPPDETSEIIEIGYATVDLRARAITGTGGLLCRPQRSRVSAFCTALTSLTAAELADAPTLTEQLTALQAAVGRPLDRQPWASWGGYDARALAEAGAGMSRSHLNLKLLHALTRGRTQGPGLQRAVREHGIAFEGRPHRGRDDALNAAHIALRLLAPR